MRATEDSQESSEKLKNLVGNVSVFQIRTNVYTVR